MFINGDCIVGSISNYEYDMFLYDTTIENVRYINLPLNTSELNIIGLILDRITNKLFIVDDRNMTHMNTYQISFCTNELNPNIINHFEFSKNAHYISVDYDPVNDIACTNIYIYVNQYIIYTCVSILYNRYSNK